MQSSKYDFMVAYNRLMKSALQGSANFPDEVCEYIVNEFDLQASVLFKLTGENTLLVLGKSNSSKKIYLRNTTFNCENCRLLSSSLDVVSFHSQPECSIPVSDFVLYEACLSIPISDSERAILKIAKRTSFSKSDKDLLEAAGENLSSLLKLNLGYRDEDINSLNDIVSNIAHELRTPANSIIGFASLLNEDNLTPSQSEYVVSLKDNAIGLLSLLNDLVDLAKINKGFIKQNLSSIRISTLIADVINILKEKADKKNIEFLVNIDKNIHDNLKYDGQKLKFILLNLISFSLRLTEFGKISIYVSAEPNKLNIRISDTGAGIINNKIKTIFNPFSFNELGAYTGNVTGLGLTLTKKYIDLLGGSVEVISSVGKGTTFNVHVYAENASMIEQKISELPKPGIKNKVLVVEDDYAASKLLSNYLNKWGYLPTIVNSADQALKIIDKEQYLAILMDIVLPDANGFELLKEIRSNKNCKNTPIIVCSVEAEQQKAFLMGAVEYFVKPIKYKYLVEVLTSYRLKRESNILIVDDDIPTLNLMKQAVEQAGFNAIAESKSIKVMSLIENLNLDLAIIDLDMPEVNGFELIKMIKTKSEFAKLPIIIYTGKENYNEDLKKIDGMFTELLQKSSSNIEDLSETINKMINRYEEPSTPEEIEKDKDAVKILLVEDYKHSQIIVTRLLKKNNFESVVVVENGAEAVDQVQKQKFDLILMDMQMPIMNGFEATEKIRQMPEYKDTPIIALTAFAMKGDREKCINAGATDYIPKPIDSQEFIEKVKYYTGEKVPV